MNEMAANSNAISLYVSNKGNDRWSGMLDEPNQDFTDGPLATIAGARDLVREYKATAKIYGLITVWIRGGRYSVSSPIEFGPDDSAPVTYKAYPAECPVIDGGRHMEGWKIEEINGNKIWVTDIPDVASGKWYFRQLFVNGRRRSRTRLPQTGFFQMEDVPNTSVSNSSFSELMNGCDTFKCAPGDVENWKNITDVEVIVPHFWVDERMPMKSFDENTCLVKSSRRSTFVLKDDVAKIFARYYVENVFEALCKPGEWYLDRSLGKLYYYPLPDELPGNTEIIAPVTEQLLILKGLPEEGRYVEFIKFEGLEFQHTDWYQPKGGGESGGERFKLPDLDLAAAPQAAFNIPGVLYLEGARYCGIENCKISHIGWYGIELSYGCTSNRIIGNEICDMGAGGIKLNGATSTENVLKRTGNNRVTDNHIHGGGNVFHSAVGILSAHSFGNDISHNHIHDLHYSGISCGWIWGYADNISKDNRIEKNHIHDLGNGMLNDLGGVYILGVQPGTIIKGNVIHDIKKHNYGAWGVYIDEGSSYITIENNICYNMDSQCFNLHFGRENIVRNNIFAFGKEGIVSHGRAESNNSFTFERNILVTNDQPLFVGGYGAQLEKKNFISDLNLFWNVSGKELQCGNGEYNGNAIWEIFRTFTLKEWRAMGFDFHSIVADPGFHRLKELDFTMDEKGLVFSLGFRKIETSDVGPRLKKEPG